MLNRYLPPENYLTQVRDVALLNDEKVTHVFSPQEGMINEPTGTGRLLITTSQRIISFSEVQGNHEILLFPIEELKGIMVKSGGRSSASLFQGLLMIAGGLIIYLVISYWLTGRIDGPTVPLINVDLGPLVILMGVLGDGWLVGKYYFDKDGGTVTFQGSNWAFSFPYSGEKAGEEIYHIVKTVFDTRSIRNGYYPPTKGV